MNNKLFVGNLSFSTGEDELRRNFEPFGALSSVALISDRMTGQSRGFGFVEYTSADDAERAIEALDGREIDGRAVNVSVARERAPSPRFEGGGSYASGRSGGSKRKNGDRRW